MAYALSWISVAGGESVMPPWVRAQFREAALIVRHLRNTPCGDAGCAWCAEVTDPARAVDRGFGFPAFRPEPADADGRPLQERIVAEALAGRSVLGILPTGTGKSVCYQIPALAAFDRIGALTVVISPLVALMADQVQGLARAGISSAVTVNGMPSLPERHAEGVGGGDDAQIADAEAFLDLALLVGGQPRVEAFAGEALGLEESGHPFGGAARGAIDHRARGALGRQVGLDAGEDVGQLGVRLRRQTASTSSPPRCASGR